MVGKVDYHFYSTVRSMLDAGEVNDTKTRTLIDQLSKDHPLKFKLRYEWNNRGRR